MRISDWSSDVCSSDLEIPYREARLVRIASYDDFVKAARQADDLKLQIILIRPEPRDMCMAHTSPAHACCRDPGLLASIIARFQLDSAAVEDDGMQCTIAVSEALRVRSEERRVGQACVRT